MSAVGARGICARRNDERRRQITVLMFPIVALVSSIPIVSIIIRYNLLQNKICNKVRLRARALATCVPRHHSSRLAAAQHVANVIAVVMPWLIALPFYTGQGLVDVSQDASLLFNGVINFVVPVCRNARP